MSGKFHYFSFGSNLSLERIRINNKSAEFFCVGLLKDFKLTFQRYSNFWKGSTANIQSDAGVSFGKPADPSIGDRENRRMIVGERTLEIVTLPVD